MTTTYQAGQRVHLPDGPSVTVICTSGGTEHGELVTYVTGRNSLGHEVTRWVRR